MSLKNFYSAQQRQTEHAEIFLLSIHRYIYGLYKPITKEIHLMTNVTFMKFSDNIAGS